MPSNDPPPQPQQPRQRRSRKSIAVMPTNAISTSSTEINKENSSTTSTISQKTKKKSRSKSLGPGGLDALNSENGLKSGSGNGRRESLAPAATVKSILKPTLPLSPIKPIPAHRSRASRTAPSIPTFTMAPTNIPTTKPPKPTTTTASSSSNSLNFNPPPATTIPVRTEEEQQRRSEILAARAARRQSLGNRRVSFAPEATLHTWDVVEYYHGGTGTPSSSSSGSTASTPANRGPGNLSTIEATPTATASVVAENSPIRLPDSLAGGQDPETPMGAAQKKNFDSPAGFSSPFSSSPEGAHSPFAGMPNADSDSDSLDSDSDSDGEPGGEDRTFMTMGGDETVGDMSMDMAGDDVTGAFKAFGNRKAWKLEGGTETVEDPTSDGEEEAKAPAAPQQEDGEEGGEMTMEMTRAVGGLLPSSTTVEYPALPAVDSENEDDGGEMTMEMTRAIGGVLPSFTNPYVEEQQDAAIDITMEMTRPIGGILTSAANALQRATRKSLGFFAPPSPAPAPAQEKEEDEDMGMTMDMTVAIGSILSRAPAPHVRSSSPVQGEDMTMDMDMTRPVGGIISAPEPSAHFVSSPAASDMGNEEMTMELTSVLGGIIGGGAKPGRRSSLAKNGGAGKLMSGADWAKQQEAQRGSEDEDDEGGDMDFTVAVGGILSKQEAPPASTFPGRDQGVQEDSDEDGDVDMDGVTMDITTAIGSILPSTNNSRPASSTNSATKQDEWVPASIAPKATKEEEEEEQEREKLGTPMPVKRRASSRRSSAASVGEGRVTRRSSAVARKSLEMQQEEKVETMEKDVTPVQKVATPVQKIEMSAQIVATPRQKAETPVQKAATPAQQAEAPIQKTETPVQKRQTPARKVVTPKSRTVTPKSQGKKKAETPKVATPKVEQPVFVFATPQKKVTTPQPHTPPDQATPVVLPRPKTPSKHTPMIQTPLRQVTSHGFSLSAKKAIGFPTSPSPFKYTTTPNNPGSPSTKGIGINQPGLGSPRVAAKLSGRKGIGESTLPFSPVAIPSDLLKASQADEAADREEEKKEKEKEIERRKGLDLKSRIELLTPRKASRKSLAYGALLQGQGKREREEDMAGYLGGGKRRKSLEYGTMSPAKRSFEFEKAPSLPTPGQGRTPKKKVMIAPEPVVASSPMAPPPKPQEEEKMDIVEEVEEESFEEEEEPKLTLQQFLSMTSISFLDGLTTTKRRPTGFPGLELRRGRRSTEGEDELEASMADCVIAGACTVPMLDLFQHSCRELKKYIKEGREVVKEIEEDTLEENPLLFREYIDAPPDVKVIMDTQFKNVKTHARFLAKGIWYEWRQQLLEGVKSALEDNLQGMRSDEETLEEGKKAAESVLPGLKERFETAKKTVKKMEEVKRRIESDDKEQLSLARETLKTVTQRIEEVKRKLAKRQKEVAEVDAQIEIKEKRKMVLQECIEEAERVKEMNRGWSEDEVATWKSKVAGLEKKSGWSICAVNGTTVELVFLKQLRVRWDATGVQATTVEYMVAAITKPSDPLPLQNTEQDFFITRLNSRLADTTTGKRSLKSTLTEIDTFWRRCISTADEIKKVRRWYPTTLSPNKENPEELKVAIKVLVPEIRSKVVIEVLVDAQLNLKSGAKVLYGGVNAEAVDEFVGKALGVGEKEGVWRDMVEDVVERCLEGKRRGGVGVPTKA